MQQCATMHDCHGECALCMSLLWAAHLQDMMVQGTSTDRYASLLLIYAVNGGICHMSGWCMLWVPAHMTKAAHKGLLHP
jgi:hypothetical protein